MQRPPPPPHSPAKSAAEHGPLGRLEEAIQSLRLTTDNGDHVQRIEIEIRTKEMAERSRLSVAPHEPQRLGWHAASENLTTLWFIVQGRWFMACDVWKCRYLLQQTVTSLWGVSANPGIWHKCVCVQSLSLRCCVIWGDSGGVRDGEIVGLPLTTFLLWCVCDKLQQIHRNDSQTSRGKWFLFQHQGCNNTLILMCLAWRFLLCNVTVSSRWCHPRSHISCSPTCHAAEQDVTITSRRCLVASALLSVTCPAQGGGAQAVDRDNEADSRVYFTGVNDNSAHYA